MSTETRAIEYLWPLRNNGEDAASNFRVRWSLRRMILMERIRRERGAP